MILIFGGAYQGKLAYALEYYKLTENDVYYCSDDCTALPCNKKIIYEIDKWILALIREGKNVSETINEFIESNKDTIVVCNDVSCGIVPTDEVLRKWREETGRAMAALAGHSLEVTRLFCGIPTKIK